MLETGDDTMAVVARRAGFGSPESLRRAFMRHLGVVPSAYRASFHTTGVDTRDVMSDMATDNGRDNHWHLPGDLG
jgi:AraC-like DNA-binding protein